MKNISENKLYKSQDFYLSAVCLAAGMELLQLERTDNKHVTFVFLDPKDEVSQIISKHWNRTLTVYSRDLVEAINEIKTRIYSKV